MQKKTRKLKTVNTIIASDGKLTGRCLRSECIKRQKQTIETQNGT